MKNAKSLMLKTIVALKALLGKVHITVEINLWPVIVYIFRWFLSLMG